ncbi:MAG: hypothetical protein K1X88_35945, partial [Nannocystaceae bacterium]|nr:hypothetical protein [Nannocystaceae bacterium]
DPTPTQPAPPAPAPEPVVPPPAAPAEPAPDPARTLQIELTAQTWSWRAHYPQLDVTLRSDGSSEVPLLVLPQGRPVTITASSAAVLVGLYLPAFRVRRDLIPARPATITLQAQTVGRFPLRCADGCGEHEPQMRATVEVVEPSQMDAALARAQAGPPPTSCSVTIAYDDGPRVPGRAEHEDAAVAQRLARQQACDAIALRVPRGCDDPRVRERESSTSVALDAKGRHATATVSLALVAERDGHGSGEDRPAACAAARAQACAAAAIADCEAAAQLIAIDGVAVPTTATPP